MVIDWRAPVSLPFYRATRDRPDGRRAAAPVRLPARRADGVRGRGPHPRQPARRRDYSAILERRDRAAARRADARHRRHHPARAGRHRPRRPVAAICVQGAPGTGKTAVGLHRAAYLLYAHREQLTPPGVLVVGPNASFLRYIRRRAARARRDRGEAVDGRRAGRQDAARGQREVVDPRRRARAVATLKGDARMAEVLHARRCGRTSTMPAEGLVVPRGARRWRVATYEVEEVVDRAARPRGAVRRRAGRCCRRRWPTGPGADGAGRRLPRRPGAGRRGAQQAGQGVRRRAVAGRRPGAARVPAALRRRRSSPRPPTGMLDRGRAGAAALGQAAKGPGIDAVVARRRGAGRRGGRPGRADAGSSATSCSTRRRTCRR